MRYLVLALAALALSGCATAQRYDAANDVHTLLVSIRDNDQATFDAHVDRPALKRQIESRLTAEGRKAGGDSLGALSAILAPALADIAGDALIQPRVFRAVADYYGYDASKPLPGAIAIGSQLKATGDGRVCATRKKDGPCLLMFTQTDGAWKLSGFDGDLSMLRTKGR